MIFFKTKVAAATGHRLAQLVVALLAAILAAPASAQLDRALTQQTQTDQRAAQSQNTINQVRDQTVDSAGKYAQAVAEAESLERFNAQLNEQVKSQQDEIASIEKQLTDIETTNREVQPLMQQMVDTLEQFVKADVPFLIDERTGRVRRLKEIMDRADVTISEKYRQILEAYQIELDYGRTLDAYDGRLPGAGGAFRTVEFVRLGRISLMYRTLDGSETGYWDQGQKKWIPDSSYAEAIEQALRVARKNGAPELLTVPVPAPQEVRS
jgi:seryl-tRNA synthetase